MLPDPVFEVRPFWSHTEDDDKVALVTSAPLGTTVCPLAGTTECPAHDAEGEPYPGSHEVEGYGIYQNLPDGRQMQVADFTAGRDEAGELQTTLDVAAFLEARIKTKPIEIWVTDGIATVDESTIPPGLVVRVRDYDIDGAAEDAEILSDEPECHGCGHDAHSGTCWVKDDNGNTCDCEVPPSHGYIATEYESARPAQQETLDQANRGHAST